MIEYRTFNNTDPPKVMQVWNEAFTGRGAVKLPTPSVLEEFVFAKPYFDPAGLILAVEGKTPVGFAHAGFAPNESGSALATDTGVICAIGVRPAYRRKGIGSELLRRAETYLTTRGASVIVAGGAAPSNPFYFGLYGGSESAGFLASDTTAEPFLARSHFQPQPDIHLVFHRRLEGPVTVADPRFVAIRRQYELLAMPHRGVASWYREAALGPIELHDAIVRERSSGQEVARGSLWEMMGYCQRWGVPAVGILELQVRPDFRRKGIAKFLMVHLMRYIQEQFFSLLEVQAPESNTAVVALYRALGFERVDTAHCTAKRVECPSFPLPGDHSMRSLCFLPILGFLLFAPALRAAPPTVADDRLVIEEVARQPDIVTPTGIAVDEQGRLWVVENHTHQRPADYKGPDSDRIRVFSDPDADGHFRKIADVRRWLQEFDEHRPRTRRRRLPGHTLGHLAIARHEGNGEGRRTQSHRQTRIARRLSAQRPVRICVRWHGINVLCARGKSRC